MSRIVRSPRSLEDLIDIWTTFALDNLGAADRVYARLQARIERLAQYPDLGRVRPDIAPGARAINERPYVIIYRLTATEVDIVRVVHGARHLPNILSDEDIA